MIDAVVTPHPKTPTFGTELTPQTFRDVGTPTVRVPTDGIVIGTGETMQVDGTLVINGTLSGSGVPTGGGGTGGATALDGLNDVTLTTLQTGEVLKWDGSQWSNQSDSGLITVNLAQLQDVDLTNLADGSTLQYDQPSGKWLSVTETEFVDAIIDGGFANSSYVDAFNIDGGGA